METGRSPRVVWIVAIGGLIAALLWVFLSEDGKQSPADEGELQTGVTETTEREVAPHVSSADSESLQRIADDVIELADADDFDGVEIVPDEDSLIVFVHDQEGVAIPDFPLQLSLEHNQWSTSNYIVRSDEQGYVYFEQLEGKLARGRSFVRVKIRASTVDPHAAEISLSPKDLPQEVLDYEVGPFGSVRLHLQANDGSPYLKQTACSLQIYAEDDSYSRRVNGMTLVMERYPVHNSAKDGEAVFPFVALGLELESGAILDQSIRPYSVQFQGPRQAGEQVEATVWADEIRPRVRFRLLDQAGNPICDQKIGCTTQFVAGASRTHGWADIRTNAEGLVDYVVTVPVGPDSLGVMTLKLTWRNKDGELTHDLELPRDLAPGVTELGDVVFSERPILISGQVLDAGGQPVSKASLMVMAKFSDDDYRLFEEGRHWADENGKFLIRGESDAEQIIIYSGSGTSHDVETSVAPGTQGIEIRLNPLYLIKGKLLLDEGISPANIMLRAAPLNYSKGQAIYPWWPRIEATADGSFVLEASNSEPVTLLITDRECGALLTSISSVTPVGAGQESDSRLAAIDLRGKLFQHYLNFRDSDGQLVKDVKMVIDGCPTFSFGSGNQFTYLTQGKGNLVLLLESFDFEASGEGQRKLSGRVTEPGETTIQMQAGIQAQVNISPHDALPNGTLAHLRLAPLDGQLLDPVYWQRVADGSGEFPFAAAAPGRYRISLLLRHQDSTGKQTQEQFPGDAQAPVIEILDQREMQHFEFPLDAEAIAKFLGQ